MHCKFESSRNMKLLERNVWVTRYHNFLGALPPPKENIYTKIKGFKVFRRFARLSIKFMSVLFLREKRLHILIWGLRVSKPVVFYLVILKPKPLATRLFIKICYWNILPAFRPTGIRNRLYYSFWILFCLNCSVCQMPNDVSMLEMPFWAKIL